MAQKRKISYNEHDENQVTKMLKKSKIKKLRLRAKILLFFVFVMLVVGYLSTDISKVHDVKISGIHDIKEADILKAIDVDKDDLYLLISKKDIVNRIKEIPLVKKVSVEKTLSRDIKIEIEETEKIAYGKISGRIYLVDEKGKIASTKDEKVIDSLKFTPQFIGFKSIGFLKEFTEEYLKIPDIIKNQISDIVFQPTSSDKTKIKFIMDNGKVIYIRVEDMSPQLNSIDYEAMITGYKDKCIFSFEGGYIYTQECE